MRSRVRSCRNLVSNPLNPECGGDLNDVYPQDIWEGPSRYSCEGQSGGNLEGPKFSLLKCKVEGEPDCGEMVRIGGLDIVTPPKPQTVTVVVYDERDRHQPQG